jgi:Fe-S cluster assembly ATP-binding protein
MLEIKNLHVNVDGKEILKGLDLAINPGETHAIMGPNGSGKSTLGYVLSGREGYHVTKGSIEFLGKDLFKMSPDERALAGLFLGMQYPVELPGVNNTYFLKFALNKKLIHEGKDPMDAMDFMAYLKEKLKLIGMNEDLVKRNVNEDFSGGEKKRNEVLQMLLLEPKLSILDELDSGLDIDALEWVAKAVNYLKNQERSFLLITHYQRLLDYIIPDYIHVLLNGKIVKTGGKELAHELERTGYKDFK